MEKGTDSEIFRNNLTVIWILGSVTLDHINICKWYYRIQFIFTTNYYSWFLWCKYLRLDLYLICLSIILNFLNFLGRKAVTTLNRVLKSRGITLRTKVCIARAMVFPVVMYGYESCTVKKAERWRIDAFELWYWRRLLRVTWIARRSNQSILKEINQEYSLDGPMLKLQYFGHLMCGADSLEKTLMLGKTEGKRRGPQRVRW